MCFSPLCLETDNESYVDTEEIERRRLSETISKNVVVRRFQQSQTQVEFEDGITKNSLGK